MNHPPTSVGGIKVYTARSYVGCVWTIYRLGGIYTSTRANRNPVRVTAVGGT